jgi:hypothetical protein
MEERLRFVAGPLDGERMSEVCRAFGTARETTPRQPLRAGVVTHVSGTFRYLCLRAGQAEGWRARRDSNPRPPD